MQLFECFHYRKISILPTKTLCCQILLYEIGPPAIERNWRNFHKYSVSCYLFSEPRDVQQLCVTEQSVVRENVKFCRPRHKQ
jgi:hypothetical protein